MSSLQQPFVGGVASLISVFRSVMRVLYNISEMLLSTAFKSGEFGGHS